MGFKESWLSISGLGKDEVLSRLGLVETGGPTDNVRSGQAGVAVHPNGRVLVIWGSPEYLTPDEAAAVTTGGAEAVFASQSDTVMHSSAWGLRDGVQVWSIERHPDDGDVVRVGGDLPASFVGTLRKATQQQTNLGDADYLHDVPIEIAAEFGLYRPDVSGWPVEMALVESRSQTHAAAVPGRSSGVGGILKKLFG